MLEVRATHDDVEANEQEEEGEEGRRIGLRAGDTRTHRKWLVDSGGRVCGPRHTRLWDHRCTRAQVQVQVEVVGLFKTGLVGKLSLHRTCQYTNEETPLSVPKQGLVPLLVYELS